MNPAPEDVLGKEYTHRFSGWKGTATGISYYLSGEVSVQLASRDNNGKPENLWLGWPYLDVVPTDKRTGFGQVE